MNTGHISTEGLCFFANALKACKENMDREAAEQASKAAQFDEAARLEERLAEIAAANVSEPTDLNSCHQNSTQV